MERKDNYDIDSKYIRSYVFVIILKVNIISFVMKILMVIVTISSVEGCNENLMEVLLGELSKGKIKRKTEKVKR